jgi:3-oxoacyl-(acyl-carrier-protein) synthase III
MVEAPVIASLPTARSSQPREYPRHSLAIQILLQLRDHQEVVGTTQDFSSGGFRATLNRPLEVGTPLSLTCSFADVAYLTLAGQVVFCAPAPDSSDSSYSASVKFTAIRDWEHQILQSALQALKEDTASTAKSLMTLQIVEDILAIEAAEWYTRVPEPFEDRPSSIRQSCLHASKITGWGAYLPPHTVTNHDVNKLLRLKGKKTRFGDVVGALSGIRSRRYAASRCYPSDLAVEASRTALQNAGVDPKDVEVIISCGVSRDVEEPATACIIQQKLGAHKAYVFDLANACNGFISAMDVLDSFIASGRCEVGLVVVGEVISQFVTWDPKSKKELHMSAMSYTLGDGGGAVVMQRAKPNERQGIHARWFLSDSSYWRIAVVPLMDAEKRRFKSNAAEIEQAALRYVPTGVRTVMQMLKWDYNDLDLIIPHQVSAPIIENLFFKILHVPKEKVYWSFPNHGNVGAASMPIAMHEARKEGRLQSGDKVLLVGGSGGFGAGVIGLII